MSETGGGPIPVGERMLHLVANAINSQSLFINFLLQITTDEGEGTNRRKNN